MSFEFRDLNPGTTSSAASQIGGLISQIGVAARRVRNYDLLTDEMPRITAFENCCLVRKLCPIFRLPVLILALLHSASAQPLTLTNGVQKYASLASTTVNMSNRCELWVTNSTTPLSGCTINLNSIDAWLFLTGVKPSVVASTYLSQDRKSTRLNSSHRCISY